jgi:hypothetical protein
MDKEKGKRILQKNRKRKEQRKKKSQPGGSLYFGLKRNQQEWREADHKGSTVSITPLLEVLDTNHHVSHVSMYLME